MKRGRAEAGADSQEVEAGEGREIWLTHNVTAHKNELEH